MKKIKKRKKNRVSKELITEAVCSKIFSDLRILMALEFFGISSRIPLLSVCLTTSFNDFVYNSDWNSADKSSQLRLITAFPQPGSRNIKCYLLHCIYQVNFLLLFFFQNRGKRRKKKAKKKCYFR